MFSNSIGYSGEQLVDDKKFEHEGWDLWVKTHQRNQTAMNTMTRYCKQDVDLPSQDL